MSSRSEGRPRRHADGAEVRQCGFQLTRTAAAVAETTRRRRSNSRSCAARGSLDSRTTTTTTWPSASWAAGAPRPARSPRPARPVLPSRRRRRPPVAPHRHSDAGSSALGTTAPPRCAWVGTRPLLLHDNVPGTDVAGAAGKQDAWGGGNMADKGFFFCVAASAVWNLLRRSAREREARPDVR